MKRIQLCAFAFCVLGFLIANTLAALPQDVLPVKISEGALSLQGEWKFKYLHSSDVGSDETFFRPSFDVAHMGSVLGGNS